MKDLKECPFCGAEIEFEVNGVMRRFKCLTQYGDAKYMNGRGFKCVEKSEKILQNRLEDACRIMDYATRWTRGTKLRHQQFIHRMNRYFSETDPITVAIVETQRERLSQPSPTHPTSPVPDADQSGTVESNFTKENQ